MEQRISILFYARKTKKTRNNLVPIYMRITVNGQRLEHSIQRYVEVARWGVQAGRVKSNSEEVRQINAYLDTLTNKVHTLERQILMDGGNITFDNFRENGSGL